MRRMQLLLLVSVVLATAACSGPGRPSRVVASQPAEGASTVAGGPAPEVGQTPDRPFGERTKDAQCVAHDGLPEVACTPGAVFPEVTAVQLCVPGYSSSVRNVPAEVSRMIYAEYGIIERSAGEFEVDHLVPLELGGSNDIANLWPEAAEPRPGFHEKDQVENYLHDQVCTRGMSLADAQRAVATNWLDVYHERAPAAAATTVAMPTPAPTALVLVPPLAPSAPPPGAAAPVPEPPGADLCGAPANPWHYTYCGGGQRISSPPSNLCSVFACIPSFWHQTRGYVVECGDGLLSHSGGRRGSCSYHGGNLRPLFSAT